MNAKFLKEPAAPSQELRVQHTSAALLLLSGTLIGSMFNIPVAQLAGEQVVPG